jgi:NarL family two-component system response regulator LiaR
VKRTVLLYGLVAGLLVVLLRVIEYKYLILSHSLEIYGGLIAVIFAVLGIWLGLKLTRVKTVVTVLEVPVPVVGPFVRDERKVTQLGLTPRELETLEALAAGHSTREIAERLGVSENTVKTHTTRVFDKLGAQRRTQAVQLAKEARLIP